MWAELFESSTGIHWVNSDHFFVDKNRGVMLEMLKSILCLYGINLLTINDSLIG